MRVVHWVLYLLAVLVFLAPAAYLINVCRAQRRLHLRRLSALALTPPTTAFA
jgi:hypothetical protein